VDAPKSVEIAGDTVPPPPLHFGANVVAHAEHETLTFQPIAHVCIAFSYMYNNR
jgi:hypothetical protein